MSRIESVLLAIVLLCAAAGFAPALACGSVHHAAKPTISAPTTVTVVAAAIYQHRDNSTEPPCNGHGCCQLGAICSIACANAAIVLDVLDPFIAERPFATDPQPSVQSAGIAVDPEIDPPRSLTLT